MDVSKNSGTPKSSILLGFSSINHPFWGTPIFGNPHIKKNLFQVPGESYLGKLPQLSKMQLHLSTYPYAF